MTSPAASVAAVDRAALEAKVTEMYAIDSFAGVGHFFHLAALETGERVVDLGSGSGMDTFVAAVKVGATGHVIGVDMTDAQLEKASRLARDGTFACISYRTAYIERTDLPDASADCVISNGVINLAPDKARVFEEAARLLRRGGRLAIADIVADAVLPDTVVCNADLWAACIGGAAQRDVLSRGDRARRASRRARRGEHRLPVRLGTRPQGDREVRREERVDSRAHGMTRR